MIGLRIHQGHLEAQGAPAEDRERLVALRDLWEERSAILEHQARFTRGEAESRALEEVLPLVAGVAA